MASEATNKAVRGIFSYPSDFGCYTKQHLSSEAVRGHIDFSITLVFPQVIKVSLLLLYQCPMIVPQF